MVDLEPQAARLHPREAALLFEPFAELWNVLFVVGGQNHVGIDHGVSREWGQSGGQDSARRWFPARAILSGCRFPQRYSLPSRYIVTNKNARGRAIPGRGHESFASSTGAARGAREPSSLIRTAT